jgi:hypothetical protein
MACFAESVSDDQMVGDTEAAVQSSKSSAAAAPAKPVTGGSV